MAHLASQQSADIQTFSSRIRAQLSYKSTGTRLHETSRDFTRLHETSRDFTRYVEKVKNAFKCWYFSWIVKNCEKLWKKNTNKFGVELSSRHLYGSVDIASRMSSSHSNNSKMFAQYFGISIWLEFWIPNPRGSSWSSFGPWQIPYMQIMNIVHRQLEHFFLLSTHISSQHGCRRKKTSLDLFFSGHNRKVVASAFKRQKRPKTSKPFQTHMLSGSLSRSNICGSYDKEAKPSNASNVSTTWENLPKYTVQNNQCHGLNTISFHESPFPTRQPSMAAASGPVQCLVVSKASTCHDHMIQGLKSVSNNADLQCCWDSWYPKYSEIFRNGDFFYQ